MASRKSCHGEGNDYIQLGDHHFSVSLFVTEPGWKNGFHEGKQAQNKLYPVFDPIRAKESTLKESQSFFSATGGLSLITAIKKCEDDNAVILRIAEMDGSSQKVNLGLFTPALSLSKTNLIEQDSWNTGQSGKILLLEMGKNSIETFKLEFR